MIRRGKHVLRFAYRAVQRGFVCDITRLIILRRATEFDASARTGTTGCVTHIRQITPVELTRLAADPVNELPLEMSRRLYSGIDLCFGLFVDGQLACYAWYALGSVEGIHNRGRERYSGTALSFPEDLAFMYKGFTRPEFRGRGFYRQLHPAVLSHLRQHRVTAIIATADWTNDAALKSCQAMGFEMIGTIWRVGLGRWVVGRYPELPSSLGIRFGRRARVVDRDLLGAAEPALPDAIHGFSSIE